MKLVYSAILLFALSINAFATRITAIHTGRWAQASTWNPNRQPQNGDTIIIPAHLMITLDFNESLNNIVLEISGDLKLNNGKLNLNAASRIDLALGASLSGSGNNDQVKIGGTFKFRGGFDLPILGPAYSDVSTGNSPNGFVLGMSLLKATLSNFSVSKLNDEVYIGWVSQPANTLRFEIEKSFNGSAWTTIASIPATNAQNYSYTDKTSGPTAYYRIREVFAAGDAYTAIKAVTGNGGISIYSDKQQIVRVRSAQSIRFPVKIVVTDMNGRVVQQLLYGQPVLFMDFKLKSLNHGRFVVHVTDAAGAEKSSIVVL